MPRGAAGSSILLAGEAAPPTLALIAAVALAADRRRGRPRPGKPGKGGGVRLVKVATFELPTFVGAPRGAGDLAFVTEREGRIRILDGGRKAGTFLDMTRWVSCCEAETGLHSIAFPPDYAQLAALLRLLHQPRATTSRSTSSRARARTRAKANPSTAAQDHRGPPERRRQPQRRAGRVRARRDALHRRPATAATSTTRAAQSQKQGLAARQAAADRPALRQGPRLRDPEVEPLREGPGRGEIYARGLRNPYRFSFDRGRILIGDVGQARREEVDVETIKRARAARTSAGASSRARPRFRKGRLRHHDEPLVPVPAHGRRLLDRRRLRRPGPEAEAARGPLRLRRLLLGRAALLPADQEGSPRRPAARRRQARRDGLVRHRRAPSRLRRRDDERSGVQARRRLSRTGFSGQTPC